MADKEQQTEEATPKRRDEAFKKGQFARSPDIQVVFLLLAGLCITMTMVPGIAHRYVLYTQTFFTRLGQMELTPEGIYQQMLAGGREYFAAVTPFIIACSVAAIVGAGLQTGFKITPDALGVKWERLDISKSWSRVLSKDTLAQLPFEIVKLLLVGYALWYALQESMHSPVFHFPVEVGHIPIFIHHSVVRFLSIVTGVLAVVATAHYIVQRWKTSRDLRMSHQEVRDEHKQSEGDPMVKSRMRKMAQQLLQKQMLAAVPLADVVLTNPTHYAVALRYENGRDQAPMVLAKGQNQMARKIREIATANEVPIVENRPLARMLYKACTVGEPIPYHLYQAVAEVLAFVYKTYRYYFHRLKQRRAAAAASGTTSMIA